MIIGLLASGSGGSLEVAIRLLKLRYPRVSFVGFSDRECEALQVLHRNCVSTSSCVSKDKTEVSESAARFFKMNGSDFVILSYSMLVSRELYSEIDCYNLHPSLLPDYKGLGAVKSAFNGKASRLGVTIHKVNDIMDGGKIVCQAITIPATLDIEYWHSLSYLMKIALLVAFIENQVRPSGEIRLHTICCTPYLPELIRLADASISPLLKQDFMDTIKNSRAFSIFSAMK